MDPCKGNTRQVACRMGQYWILVNLTKGEYVLPTGGMKLCEIAGTPAMMFILAGLIADDCNGSGGGDFRNHPSVGRWAGDTVIFTGDYGKPGQHIARVAKALGKKVTEDDLEQTLYHYIREHGFDITDEVCEMAQENM